MYPPDEISSLLATQPTSSLNLIHHNYIGHFQSLEDVINAIDCLSFADMIMNEWRSDLSADLGVNLAVRGVMTANTNPVTGKWMPIRSAKNQQPNLDYEKERKIYEISSLISSNNYACDYRTYTRVIPQIEKADASNPDETVIE